MGFDLIETAKLQLAELLPLLTGYLTAKVSCQNASRETAARRKMRDQLIAMKKNAASNDSKFVHMSLILLDYWKQDIDLLMKIYPVIIILLWLFVT